MRLFDSGPCIAILGNLNAPQIFELLAKSGAVLFVPTGVVDEVTGDPEQKHLQVLVKESVIRQLSALEDDDVDAFQATYPALGRGESEVILWALRWQREGKEFHCVLDDKKARATATKLSIPITGTIGLLEAMHSKTLITDDELKHHLHTLEKAGFRYTFKNKEIRSTPR